jgi:hypothetical protein
MGRRSGLLVVLVLFVVPAVVFVVPAFMAVPGATAAATTSSEGALSRTASLPRAADVVRGRFVRPVDLDAGVFTVVPAPKGDRPRLSQEQAAQEIWASPVLQGHEKGPLGYGLVTISLRANGIPRLKRLRAWVGFARSPEVANCPAEFPSATSNPTGESGVALPSSGYAAVVIGTGHGAPAVTYTARTALCGTVQPPAVAAANEVLSVPWRVVTGVENDSIALRASLPDCGQLQGVNSAGSAKVVTIIVDAVVPDVHGRCHGPHTVRQTVALGPVGDTPGAPPPLISGSTVIRHGRLGPSLLADAPHS